MMKRFQNKKVIITGGGSGIGQATVYRILEEGGIVVAADISTDGLNKTKEIATKKGLAANLTTMVIDISNEKSVHEQISGAISQLGGVDVLVNAAGILRSSHTHLTTLEAWNTIISINLTGTFLVTREALPALLASGKGVIINFSSTSASFAHPYMAAYAASKGGIQSFTHTLALEYSKQGLRAVAVAPGSIDSGMTNNPGIPADADMSLFAKMSPAILQGFASPDDVAGVIAMLASDDGKFVTGTELRIDGGTHM